MNHPSEFTVDQAKEYCINRDNLVLIETKEKKREYCIWKNDQWWSADLYTQKLQTVFCKDEDIEMVRGLTGFDY